jgi:SAM-dependent methyltransferase
MPRPLLGRLFPHDGHHVAGWHDELRRTVPARGRVLDLGCGANRDLAVYRSAAVEVWGTDFDAHPALEHARWFRPLRPGGAIPFDDGSFDVVFANMVLEHLRDPAAFLAEVRRVLRPGGTFLGHTISGDHYVTWARRLVGLLPHAVNQLLVKALYGREPEDTFPACYRLNTRTQLARACREAGVELMRVRRYADPGYFRFAGRLMDAATVIDRLMEGVGPGLGRLYLTVVIRKPDVNGGFSRAAA